MLICCECGNRFDSSDAKCVRELVGEFWGTPAYETWMYCPSCGSEYISDLEECSCCREVCKFREEEDEDDI